MAEWVVVRLILDVCDRETGYEGGGGVPGAVVGANGGQKATECYVKRDSGGGKGVAFEILKAWRG